MESLSCCFGFALMFLDSQAHSFPFFGFLLGYKLVKPHALEKLVSKRERIKKKRERKKKGGRKEGREIEQEGRRKKGEREEGRVGAGEEITSADHNVGKLGPLCIAEASVKWCHATKTSTAVPHKIKQNYHMIQQCHFWISTQRN